MAAKLATSALRQNLSDALNRVAYGGERIVLERRGRGIAVLVPIDDLQAIEALEDKIDVAVARRARRERGSVPLSKVKARLGL